MSSEYKFTYKELKPLIDILKKEPVPPEAHFPGINHILDRLMEIANDHAKRSRTEEGNDSHHDNAVEGKPK